MVKRMMIIIGVVAVVLIFLFVLMNQGPPDPTALTSEELGALRVAVHNDLAKMGDRQYMDQPLEGFEVDLSGQLAQKIYGDEKLLDLKASTGRTALVMLDNKDVDCVVATQVAPEKSEAYLYSDAYYTDEVKVLYKNGSPANVGSFGADQKIGVLSNSPAAAMLEKAKSDSKSQVKIVLLESYPDAQDFLEQGKIDAFCGGQIFLQDFEGTQSFELGTCEYSIVLRKDDTKLLEEINKALGSLRESGQLNQLKDRWK